MTEELINQIPIEDISELGPANKTVTTKPYTAIYVWLVVSVLMLFTKLWILSVFILPLSLYALWKLPNEKRVAFYDEYLIIFPPKRYDVCQKITYDEIVEWRVTQGKTGADSFILRLTNERYITTDCFNAVKIYKAMDSIIPDKEANYVRKKNTPNTPFTFNFGKKRKK